MSDLQIALFGLGGVFILGLVIWEWRRSRRRHAQSGEFVTPVVTAQGEEWSRRVEPRIDSLTGNRREAPLPEFEAIGEVPPMHANAPVSVPVMRESAVDRPGAAHDDVLMSPRPAPVHEATPAFQAPSRGAAAAFEAPVPEAAAAVQSPAVLDTPADLDAPASHADESDAFSVTEANLANAGPPILWPPQNAERVLTLRIVGRNGELLAGRATRQALEQAGLVFGPQRIFHRVDPRGVVLASAANMLRPGDLDPDTLDEQQLRGLSLFTVLPGPFPASRMLDDLVSLARSLASRLNANVLDEQGQDLDAGRLLALRQSLSPAQVRS